DSSNVFLFGAGLFKLDGRTGRGLWAVPNVCFDDVALDGGRAVYSAQRGLSGGVVTSRFDGLTGRPVWGGIGLFDDAAYPARIVLDAQGQPISFFSYQNAVGSTLRLVGQSSSSGERTWGPTEIRGDYAWMTAQSMAIDSAGDAVVAGGQRSDWPMPLSI